MRTANPVLSRNPFSAESIAGLEARSRANTMTVRGTAMKALFLLAVCLAAAALAWSLLLANPGLGLPFILGGMAGGFVLALIIAFVPKAAPILSPVYATLQGAFLAAVSLFAQEMLERKSPGLGEGLIFQAVLLTLGVFGATAIAYSLGLVRVTGTVRKIVMVAMLGTVFYFLVVVVCNYLLGMSLPNAFAFDNASPWSIGFSLLMIVLAALNLVMDFQFIEEGSAAGAPKHMEWYGAFGLLVTLVWLYIEMLRLLSKLRSR